MVMAVVDSNDNVLLITVSLLLISGLSQWSRSNMSTTGIVRLIESTMLDYRLKFCMMTISFEVTGN